MPIRSLLLATTLFSVPAALNAQQVPSQLAQTQTAQLQQAQEAQAQRRDRDPRDDFHGIDPDIVITAPIVRSTTDVLSGTTVLSGTRLTRELRPTIGDTLARQPGVSATSFGPNASRPVLRGFQGERIRILQDGIGSFDVSNTSVDHAVTINPLTAERVEVLRGPSALLFGSSAIGGVVNVIDRRIPRALPDEAFHLDGIATYGSAADERSVGGSIDLPVAGAVVLHADGSWSRTNDLRTGGFILSPALRAIASASDDEEIREDARLRGRIDNTASETWEVAGGASIVIGGSHLGVSLSRYDSLYGIPPRIDVLDHHDDHDDDHDHDHHDDHDDDHGHGHGHSHNDVQLHVRQTRGDLRGDILTGGGVFERIRVRAGFADYRHDEIEDDGEIGTSFFNQGYEGRLELVQTTRGNWQGAVGGQFFLRNFFVEGEEKFLPRNETQQYGVFTLQSVNLGVIRAEGGARYERSILTAQPDADLGTPAADRRFDAFSFSLGANLAFAEGWRVGLNGSRSERAPSAEELFAAGPHAGTQSFEIGDPALAKERSWGLEASLRGAGNGWTLAASAYHNWLSDYIYQAQTGEEIEDLPVFRYLQNDARYWGFEVEGSARLAQLGSFALSADALVDYVRATIVDDGPAPRIPPLRVLGGLEAQGGRVTARVEAEHVTAQNRIAAFETATDDYTLVNASVVLRPFSSNATRLIVSANNIFDVEARRHASFLKDFAPLAGRDIRITLRATY